MSNAISRCRICGNIYLDAVIHLGEHALTGVFPQQQDHYLTTGPLELVKCRQDNGRSCGLLQSRYTYDVRELYGDHYGYRSSLNGAMVSHLQGIVRKILQKVHLEEGDSVVDIGSNDSTLLQAYPKGKHRLVGVDPAGNKFRKYYPNHIELIVDFFSGQGFRERFDSKRVKIITSIAMFYDLEDPMAFAQQVYDLLADDGLWVFEQSYMPAMLEKGAYDAICHEHFEHYSLKQIKWMTDRVGFKIIDVEFNEINGGSFLVMAAKSSNNSYQENTAVINSILENEEKIGDQSFDTFAQQVYRHRNNLIEFVQKAHREGKKVFGYGASTKGNVLLQYCGFTDKDITCIGEVNEDKFGCFTPGTAIPIIDEAQAKKQAPDYFLVFPWHFKESIIRREQRYIESGGSFVFPLPFPEIEVYPRRR